MNMIISYYIQLIWKCYNSLWNSLIEVNSWTQKTLHLIFAILTEAPQLLGHASPAHCMHMWQVLQSQRRDS